MLTFHGPDRARRGAELQDPGLVRDGAVLFRAGRIVAAGTTDALAHRLRKYRIPPSRLREINCRGRLLTPGLVDSHTHLVFAAPRLDDFERRIAGWDSARILAAGGGILESVRHLRATPDSLLLKSARARLRIMRAQGVTTVEIKSGYGLSVSEELRILRLSQLAAGAEGLDAALTLLGAHAVPMEFAGRRQAYLRLLRDQLLPAVRVMRPKLSLAPSRLNLATLRKQNPIAEFVDVFCDPLAFTLPEARAWLRAARRYGFRLKIHADQTADSGGAALAAQLGAVSADHLDFTPPPARRRLANSSTVATFLPGVSLFMNRPFPAARDWIADGAAINLASDFNPGTAPLLSLPLVMALGCDAMRLTPAEAWHAVTLNAAAALNRERLCGSLMPGKRADLALFDTDDFRAVPYLLGGNLCAGVWCAGHWHPAGK